MSGFDPQVPGYDPEHRQQNFRRATRLKRRRLAVGIGFAALPSLLTSGPTHPSLTSLAAYPTSAANSYPGAPYYLPAGLDAASLLSSGADTSADVTFHGGQVTAVGILP